MKHHQNKAGSKRRLLQAVFHKSQGNTNAMRLLGTAALLSTVTFSWAANDETAPPKKDTLPEVVVTGKKDNAKDSYKADDLSLTKYTQSLLDTPQSISVIPRQLMDDQGVTTLRDAVRNVAGITILAGEGGSQGDNLTLRGFSARSDIFLDGMRDFGSYYRDAFDYDSVEVLKGPSSITFGRGSTGGVVNQVTKAPEKYREISGDFTLGSNGKIRESIDVNSPLSFKGVEIKNAAIRVNAFNEQSEVSGRDGAKIDHKGVATALAFGMGTDNRLNIDFLHEDANDIPDYGVPWRNDSPAKVDRNNYYGFVNNNFLKTTADVFTVKGEHDFNDNVTIRDQVRYGHYSRHFSITEPQIASPNGPTSAILVTRNQIAGDSVETFLQNQLDLTTKFNTGFIGHTLVTGIEAGRETSEPTRYTWTGVPGANLVLPNDEQAFAGVRTLRSIAYSTGDTLAFYTLDTMKLSENWEIVGGARWDRFNSRYKDAVTNLAFSRTDKMTSWRGALVYKPVENGSIYFDYGTSFNPSAEALSISAATANIAPEENETYELGTKWDVFNKKATLRGSIYETVKENARETDPNNTLLNVLAGQQKVQGLEIEASGHLTNAWQIYTGYSFMKSRLDKSNFYPTAVGNELANVPQNMFNFWSTYNLPGKLSKFDIGGGGNYVDSRRSSSTAATAANGLIKELPSYWVFNSMVAYHFNKNIDFQLNVYNLADKLYYDQPHPNHVILGEGRTVTLTTKFKF